MRRHIAFCAGKCRDRRTGGINHLDTVCFRTDGRWAIEDDHVAVLLFELSQGVDVRVLVRFEREPHDPAVRFVAAQIREDISGFDQFKLQRNSLLGQFPGKPRLGPLVAHSGRGNHAVTLREELIADIQ